MPATPHEMLLTFGTTEVVGTKLHAQSGATVQLAEQPTVIHPYWHKHVIIDNRYPAHVYEYNFLVVADGSGGALDYLIPLYNFDALSDIGTTAPTDPRTLLIQSMDNSGQPDTPLVSYGLCYFAGSSQSDPGDVLFTNFGLVEVRFIGTAKPVLL